jgi:hypothetical protein
MTTDRLDDQVVQAVERTVADLVRHNRRDLWPRFTAREAGVSTAEARDVMVNMAEHQLLDLWYVVLCDSGDEVKRIKHPLKPPIGETVFCGRCDGPEPFTVDESDIYLLFSATDRLRNLGAKAGPMRPKEPRAGVTSPAHAPARGPDPEERASRSPLWADGQINITVQPGGHLVLQGDVIHGDQTGGDKTTIGGDQVGRDKVGGDQHRSPTQTRPRTASAVVTTVVVVLTVVVFACFITLGVTEVLEWKVALPCALGGGLLVSLGSLVTAQLRS